jgi:hypothetical protein
MDRKPHLLDIGSTITVGLTFLLFAVSVMKKGLTHELLQEAAVFLVSVKLIIGTAHARLTQKEMNRKLSLIEDAVRGHDFASERNQSEQKKAG